MTAQPSDGSTPFFPLFRPCLKFAASRRRRINGGSTPRFYGSVSPVRPQGSQKRLGRVIPHRTSGTNSRIVVPVRTGTIFQKRNSDNVLPPAANRGPHQIESKNTMKTSNQNSALESLVQLSGNIFYRAVIFPALLAGLLLLLFGAPAARAIQIPLGCTGSGLGINLFTSSPDVHIGDTLYYSVQVFNGIPGSGRTVCDAEAIQAFIVTPDGVSHTITLTRTYLSQGQSDFYPDVVSYVVRPQDILPDGSVRATANDTGIIHQNDTDSVGGGFQGVNTEVSLPCIALAVQCVGGVGENGAITFSGTVTNCGNNTLVGVTISNSVNGGLFPVTFITNLLRGGSASFSGSWVPLNPCSPSTATFTAQGVDQFTTLPRTVTSSANTTCQNTLTPGMAVTKTCPVRPVSPGQLLTFSGSVSNTGNVALTNIVVVNNQPVAGTVVFTLASLASGAVTNFTGSYLAPTNCSAADTLTPALRASADF